MRIRTLSLGVALQEIHDQIKGLLNILDPLEEISHWSPNISRVPHIERIGLLASLFSGECVGFDPGGKSQHIQVEGLDLLKDLLAGLGLLTHPGSLRPDFMICSSLSS